MNLSFFRFTRRESFDQQETVRWSNLKIEVLVMSWIFDFPKNLKTQCGNYSSIFLVSHASKALLKVVARRLGEYCERKGLLSE